jgi:Domain of unknown function (DUF4412)
MSKISALAAAMIIGCWAVPASAGVVITQQQTLQHGSMSHSSQQTVMVQGNKQKIVDNQRIVIFDLDQLKQYMLLPSNKTYFVLPIKPRARPHMMPGGRGTAVGFDFKKTGKSRTVSGYKCDDYEATGQSMSGEYTTTQCVSKTAPGAAEFAAFQRTMLDKMKSAEPGLKVNPPDGIPIASDSSVSRGHRRSEGSGAQGFGPSHGATPRPPTVIHTVVTKIVTEDLPASTFAVPSDYKQIVMGAAAVPGAGAPAQSPAAQPSSAAKPSGE